MPAATAGPTICADRKQLLAALTRIKCVVPNRSTRPILEGVRLVAEDGDLRLSAADLDISLITRLTVDGDLPECVVHAGELIRRLKTCKSDACTIQLDDEDQALVLNAGRVEHRIHTMGLAEFPPIAAQPRGATWHVAGEELRNSVAVTLRAVATETSRYAIDGILLECDEKGGRLVATDGRRMVVADLDQQEGTFEGQVLLPRSAATLIGKLIGKKAVEPVKVSIDRKVNDDDKRPTATICVTGLDWLLSFRELEGCFPRYRDVIPASHSKFVVDRRDFIEVLSQVATATSLEAKGVRLDLSAESVRVSANSTENGEASGTVEAEFLGGGDNRIITGFNPSFLLDAFMLLPDDRVVIDVAQNRVTQNDGRVTSSPALISGHSLGPTRWVLMPINLGLDASRETLGSNFEPGGETDSTEAEPVAESAQPATPAAAATDSPTRRRRRVEHTWPEIGTRLDGEFRGETSAALVVASPKLKAGRALQVINGPAFGRTFNSMTSAMVATTAKQRQKLAPGTRNKGLPTSGWDFWHPVDAKRMSA